MLQKFLKKIRSNPNHPINNKLVKECTALDNMKKKEENYYDEPIYEYYNRSLDGTWNSPVLLGEEHGVTFSDSTQHLESLGQITRSESNDTITINMSGGFMTDATSMNSGYRYGSFSLVGLLNIQQSINEQFSQVLTSTRRGDDE